MKKNVFAILMALVFGFGVGSAQTVSLAELREMVEEMNSECPKVIDEGMSLTSAKLEGGNVVMTFLVDDAELLPLIEMMKDSFTDVMLNTFMEDAYARIALRACADNKLGRVFRFTAVGATPVDLVLPYDKLEEIIEGNNASETALRAELEALVFAMQEELPLTIDETMVYQSIEDTGKEVRNTFIVDKDTYDVMVSNPETGRSSLKEAYINEENMQVLLSLCKSLGMNFTIRFVNRDTNEKYDYVFKPSEL